MTVKDTEAPTLAGPADLTTTNDLGQCYATGVSLGVPVATNDNCGLLSVTNNAPAVFPVGVTLVIWTAVDLSGNLATCLQTVTVKDTEKPVITVCALGQSLIAGSNQQATLPNLTGGVTAADNCSAVTVTQSPEAGFLVGLGTTEVTLTASDGAGNSASCTSLVVVSDPSPGLVITGQPQSSTNELCGTVSLTVTVSGMEPFSYQWYYFATNALPDATNAVLTLTLLRADQAGDYTVAVAQKDDQATSEVAVLTLVDPAPTIICPANVVVNTDSGTNHATNLALGQPVTGDNCGVASVTNNAPASFPVGPTTVTWTVTDTSGNTNTCVQTVTVHDTEPPTITCPPNVVVSTDAGTNQATNVALGQPVTSDNCGVASMTNNAPVSFPVGPTTVTWTVTDNSGNTSTCVQTVTVRDGDLPEAAYVTGVVLGALRNDWSGWVGMQVVVGTNPVRVTQLGRMMAPGNSGTHTVKLMQASDETDVAGGSVAVAMSGGTAGQFQYGSLSSPVTLAAGTTYWVLSEELRSEDSWYDYIGTVVTTTGVAADTASVWGTGPGDWHTYPVTNQAFGPVDFKYISDTPPAVVTVAASDAAAGEPGTNGMFTFTRTGASAADLTVNFTVSGTATSGKDYLALGTSFVIPAGSATATVPVSVIDDPEPECDETVVLTLGAGSGYCIGSPAVATVTISDDDLPVVSAPMIVSITITASGVELGFTGATNLNYVIVASSDLQAWESLGSPEQICPGIYRFTDHSMTNYPTRFYRVRSY